MKIEHQCCTLSQAKRLRELGVIAESLFVHLVGNEGHERIGLDVYYLGDHREQYAAYTGAELGQMLPDYYVSWRFQVHINGPLKWIATVICAPKPPGIDDIHTASEFDRFGDTQAEALSNLLISLLETGVITPEEVNERLSK